MKNIIGKTALFAAFSAVLIGSAARAAEPIRIIDQGQFAAGGTVIEAKESFDPVKPKAEGQTLHGDHAVIHYQIPEDPRALPLVFLHGYGQHARTWDTTPDGREGYRNLFLCDGYSVYLVNQPRRAAAGRATVSHTIEATPDDQFWFGQFCMGGAFPGPVCARIFPLRTSR